MAYPAFFDDVPTITLQDPLSRLLGAADGGLIEYSYAETVKLTGHSCPTVAGAWLMTVHALKRLDGEAPPERGAISVSFRNSDLEGVTGVIASVVGYITGATSDRGFKRIRGHFDPRGLLHFELDIDGDIRYERIDTGEGVTVSFNAAVVPAAPNLGPLLFAAIEAEANSEQRAVFAEVWQNRVRRIFEN